MYNGFSGKAGEEWRAEQYTASLPPFCVYLSLHPKEAGGEIMLHTEQWQKKRKVSRGGGGGSQGGCAGLVLGGAEALQRTEPQLWAAGGGLHPALVEVQFAARRPSSEEGIGKVVGSRKAKHLQQSKLNPKPSP